VSWNVWVIVRGQAEPPITTRLRKGSVPPVCSRCCSSASHTVGTPAVQVTLWAFNSSWIDGPSSFMPGNTRVTPEIGAAKASDHPLAWNNGTTGSTTSVDDRPSTDALLCASACNTFERCESRTPLGFPVVPEV
jgi:hypothetical protein